MRNNIALTAADVLARRLFDAGCRHAFGMPGGEVLVLIEALERAGIKFLLAKHENAAGFMAEGVYHRTGAPAILVATLGPGALNGVNVVANAHQDRVPMIVLTGCIDADEALSYTHQVLDHGAVFAPITKAQFRLSAGAATNIADRAVTVACDPRPGPVHVDVPISVAEVPVVASRALRRAAPSVLVPLGADLERARAALGAARRPMAILGLDLLHVADRAAMQAFVEHFGIPCVTTYKAKGIVPETHPLCLGAAGLSPLADRHLLPLFTQADVVLAIGYDPIEMRSGWRDPWSPDEQTVIDISPVANTHYMHQASLQFCADIPATLDALASGTAPATVWPDAEPAQARRALGAAFHGNDDWGPAAVIDEARAVLPSNTLASADSGAHRILLSQMWTVDEPRALVQSSGLCTMGCALPLAIGMKLAAPDRPVVSFSGDAGFLMVAGELATAAELSAAVICIVFVDGALALIEKKQREREMANRGVDFARHDFAAIGQAFGGAGTTVHSRAELRDALKAAMARPVFSVIAAQIDKGAYDGRI